MRINYCGNFKLSSERLPLAFKCIIVIFFLIEENILFSNLDFCTFSESINLKICEVITDIAAYKKLHFPLFL